MEWGISDDCDRFRINEYFFIQPLNSPHFIRANESSLNFNVSAVDSNVTTVLTTDNRIFRINHQMAAFDPLIFNENITFNPESKLKTWRKRVVIWSANNTNASAYAFSEDSLGVLTTYLQESFPSENEPKVQISENLTKIFIIGGKNPPSPGNIDKVPVPYGFFIDYAKAASKKIAFPSGVIRDATKFYMDISERFLYVRQLNNTANESNIPHEFAYYLKEETIPVLVYDRVIGFNPDLTWVKSLVMPANDGKNYVLSEFTQGSAPSNRVVYASEVNGEQASLNSDSSSNVIAEIVNGKVKLCPPGCSDCLCTDCISGYVKDTTTSSCRPCPPGCLTCNSDNNEVCGSCIVGAFVNYTTSTCDPCDPKCISCNGTATGCSVCPPGEFYGSTQCEQCPSNCFNCSDAVTCLNCIKGFTVTNTSNCRACIFSCSDCNPDNITECTDCAAGL